MVQSQTVAEQSKVSSRKIVTHGKLLVERYKGKKEGKRRHQG